MDRDTRTAEAALPVQDDDGELAWRPAKDPDEEARADEFERRVRAEAQEQFRKIKDCAQEVFGLTWGRVGVRTPEEWAALLDRAGDEIGNGRFVVRCLGAERYLDPEIVAVLITLRQNLIGELENATAADVMTIDAAIISYYNMVRTQRWVGDLSLVVERDLFGQEPLNQFHGPTVGNRLEEQLSRLAEVMLPLQERAARMMMRSLEALRAKPPTRNSHRHAKNGRAQCKSGTR